MKNEKFELLLNKMVELKSDKDHLKGFLYRDGYDYYIKPIEVYQGTGREEGKFWISDSDAEFVKFSDSPKLMKISMNSWHYRLMQYILGSNAPTPKTMQNGCPYFWLLVFCLLVTPLVITFKGLGVFVMSSPALFYGIVHLIANIYIRYMPEEQVITYAGGDHAVGWYGHVDRDAPVIVRKHFKHTNQKFMDVFLKMRYGIDPLKDKEAYDKKVAELKAKNEEWERKREELRKQRDAEYQKKEAERRQRQYILDSNREARRQRSRAAWKPFHDKMAAVGNFLEKAITFDYKNSTIIKRTKQVIGLIISAMVLAITVWVVFVFTRFFINVIDGVGYLFSHYLAQIGMVVGALIAGTIIVGIGYLLYNWIQTIIDRYKKGYMSWYVKLSIYGIGYPIKYFILGILYFLWYVVCVPVKFIFYDVLWNYMIVPVGMFLWGILRAFGGIVLGSMGVFGEYFGASKKDYCPGIEWTDVPEEYRS